MQEVAINNIKGDADTLINLAKQIRILNQENLTLKSRIAKIETAKATGYITSQSTINTRTDTNNNNASDQSINELPNLIPKNNI